MVDVVPLSPHRLRLYGVFGKFTMQRPKSQEEQYIFIYLYLQ